MVAVDEDRPSVRKFDLLAERVLAVAGVYGPNASGKSNVIEALSWLSTAVARSLRAWDQFIRREPFKFGNGLQTPSTYEVEMVIDRVRYAYRLEVDDADVLFEGLYSYPERRRRVLFEREGSDIRFRRGLGALSGTRELLTPTTLALSAAMRFDEPEVQHFARALAGIGVLGVRRRAPWRRPFGAGMLGVCLRPGACSTTKAPRCSPSSTIQTSFSRHLASPPWLCSASPISGSTTCRSWTTTSTRARPLSIYDESRAGS
ncbi:MAG: AAA family ATPase [Acidimicrobiales bacterium]